MSTKDRILAALDDRRVGGLVHRLLGERLRSAPKLMGLRNPLFARQLVIERNGARFVAEDGTYLLERAASRDVVRFDGAAFEPEVSFLIKSLIHPGDVVLDIGANVGVHTVALARLASPGQVIAFEPVAEMAERNSLNCSLNGLSNVTIVACGLGAENGTLTMNVNQSGSGMEGTSSFIETVHVTRNPAHYQTRTLPVRRLDDVLAEMKPEGRISFIKIDTEGFEPPVLDGARETIRTHRPAMLVEAHSTRLARLGKSFLWYRDSFPDHHVLMVPAVTPANPYLRLEPLHEEPPEIAINLLLLPRTRTVTPA